MDEDTATSPAQCFGPRTGEIARRIVAALVEAHRVGRRTQRASGQRQRHPYGSTWPSSHEQMVEHLGDLDGVATVRVTRTSYRLVRIDGRVLVPFALAHVAAEVPPRPRLESRALRELVARRVPGPPDPAGLFEIAAPVRPPLYRGGLRPVLVGVVGHADREELGGLLWGVPTAIDDDGHVTWAPDALYGPGAVPAPRAAGEVTGSGEADVAMDGRRLSPG